MARAEDGTLIDPFGGAADLAAGVLRHVSPCLCGGPAARVCASRALPPASVFTVAPETEVLMRVLAAGGELASVVAERVWQELSRGLMEPYPSRMLGVLRNLRRAGPGGCRRSMRCTVFRNRFAAHPELDTGVHVALALDYAATKGFALAVRYAVLRARSRQRRNAARSMAGASRA